MKRRIKAKDLAKVKNLDLLSYYQNYEPDELILICRGNYTTKTHSSLKLSNGKWFYFKTQVGGTTALNFFTDVKGYQFLDAALYLLDLINKHEPVITNNVTKSSQNFILPRLNKDNSLAINYLVNQRCIDIEIVNYCINESYIYQSLDTNHVVFVGWDLNEYKARYATTRSIDSTQKGDVKGSDKRYSFSLTNQHSDVLHIFESAIDLLSYLTLLKKNNVDYLKDNYLSLSGVSGKTSIALDAFLNRNLNIKVIYTHLDYDDAGLSATRNIINIYGKKYNVYDSTITSNKDVNEYLISKAKTWKKEEEK